MTCPIMPERIVPVEIGRDDHRVGVGRHQGFAGTYIGEETLVLRLPEGPKTSAAKA